MPTGNTALSFFGLAILLALAPGPDNVFVLLHSALHGRKAGLLVVLGLGTGLLGHTAAVVLGLAAVFAASPAAFTGLKLGGAAYLLWLAWQAFRAPATLTNANGEKPLNAWQCYARGVVMNLTNPKVALFFLAFLPQFTQPEAGQLALQIVCLGALFILATLITFGAIACGADMVGTALKRSPRIQQWLNQAAGIIFLALALRLILTQR